MALIRILIDGYSLLHNWPELAPDSARHSEAARDALIEMLTHYQDASGTPVTVFFDGNRGRYSKPKNAGGKGVEVLYSSAGQTADDLIERAAHRFQPYGEVLVVTDDLVERDMVAGFGSSTASCANFIQVIGDVLNGVQATLEQRNRREREGFRRGRGSLRDGHRGTNG